MTTYSHLLITIIFLIDILTVLLFTWHFIVVFYVVGAEAVSCRTTATTTC